MKRLLMAGAAASLILAGQAFAQTGTPPSDATAAPGPTNGAAAQGQAGMGKYDPASSSWAAPPRGVGVQSDPANANNGQGAPAPSAQMDAQPTTGQGANGQDMSGQAAGGQNMNQGMTQGGQSAQGGAYGGAMAQGQDAQGTADAGTQSTAMASGAPANGAWPLCSASRHDYCRQRGQGGMRTAANHHRHLRARHEREVATGM